MVDLSTAILAINSEAKFSINGEDVNQITWYNNTTPISVKDIKAKQTELQAEYNAKQYQRDRANEYPSIVDQLDDIFHNGIDSWKLKIQTIKDKYPKV
jgi:hypothetical protein